MKLLNSKALMTHIECGESFEVEDIFKAKKCPNCGEDKGTFSFKCLNGSCADCKSFLTNSMIYPSGKCKLHSVDCGEGVYCKDFTIN